MGVPETMMEPAPMELTLMEPGKPAAVKSPPSIAALSGIGNHPWLNNNEAKQ
jgi:hypothetical protein